MVAVNFLSSPARLGLLSGVAFALALGCSKSPKSSVRVSGLGAEQLLLYGVATPEEDGLVVSLSTHQKSCDKPDDANPNRIAASFKIPPGPAGHFYATHGIGTTVLLSHGSDTLTSSPGKNELRLKSVEFRANGSVTGSLAFEAERSSGGTGSVKGAGDFEVRLCSDPQVRPLAAQPDKASEPLKGTVAGRAFTPQSAYLFTERVSDQSRIKQLVFLPQAGGCGLARLPSANGLTLSNLGASSQGLVANSPVPVDALFQVPGARSGQPFRFGGRLRAGWLQLESVAFEPGSTVKGSLFLDNAPNAKPEESGRVSGSFEAHVCAEKPPSKSAPLPKPIDITVGDKTVALRSGFASITDEGLKVTLSSIGPESAGAQSPQNAELVFHLSPGPEGRFYAGQRIMAQGAELQWPWAAIGSRLTLLGADLILEPRPVRIAEYGRVAGKLVLSTGAMLGAKDTLLKLRAEGEFEVPIGEDEFGALEQITVPARFPEEPFSLVAQDGRKLVAKGARIILTRHSYLQNVKVLHMLQLYEEPPTDCADSKKKPFAEASGILVDGRNPLIGVIQPTWFVRPFFSELAFLRFDQAELKARGKARGALFAQQKVEKGKPDRTIAAGSFEALVCPAL